MAVEFEIFSEVEITTFGGGVLSHCAGWQEWQSTDRVQSVGLSFVWLPVLLLLAVVLGDVVSSCQKLPKRRVHKEFVFFESLLEPRDAVALAGA